MFEEQLRRDLAAQTAEALERLELPHLAPAIDALYRFERSLGGEGDVDPLTELLACADIYDALTAPKLYKGAPWRITGVLEELLHLPYCQAAERPIFQAFVDMMKPKDAAIVVRPATTVVLR